MRMDDHGDDGDADISFQNKGKKKGRSDGIARLNPNVIFTFILSLYCLHWVFKGWTDCSLIAFLIFKGDWWYRFWYHASCIVFSQQTPASQVCIVLDLFEKLIFVDKLILINWIGLNVKPDGRLFQKISFAVGVGVEAKICFKKQTQDFNRHLVIHSPRYEGRYSNQTKQKQNKTNTLIEW